jgi:hypothetical protein
MSILPLWNERGLIGCTLFVGHVPTSRVRARRFDTAVPKKAVRPGTTPVVFRVTAAPCRLGERSPRALR